MESKVKERIIGAAVLVALGVWLIPWVLDGSRSPEPEADTAVSEDILPASANPPVRTETVELNPVDTSPPRSRDTTPASEPEDPPAPIASAEVADEPADSTPAPQPAAPVAAPAAAGSAAAADVVVAANDSSPDTGWSVQLGSFGELANAQQLASRVSEYGYEARVSDFRSDGRTMHRVRVGGFDSREQADAAASSLAAHNFVARVFPPAE